ncbi:MAG: hypothetical protein HY608_07660 [Planctomycetes bacterium]|nr:hypothetical protein [Planctomycetota bacterium]
MRTVCLLLILALPLGPGAGFCCCLVQSLVGGAPCGGGLLLPTGGG